MKLIVCVLFCACAVMPVRADSKDGDDGTSMFGARLSGFEEVLPVYTNASGRVSVRIEQNPPRITVTMNYTGLTGQATMAHLHWGQHGVNGPVILPICGTGTNNACPANNGTESSFTFTAANLLAAGAVQGGTGLFPANNLTALLEGLRNGAVYANVHTAQLPGGEIRGQLGRGSQGRGRPDADEDDDHPGQGKGNGNGRK